MGGEVHKQFGGGEISAHSRWKTPVIYLPPCGYSSEDGVLCDKNHRVVVHSEVTSKQLICTECLRKFSDLNTLIQHMHWSHGVDRAFPCGECTNVFKHVVVREVHHNLHRIVSSLSCATCLWAPVLKQPLHVLARARNGVGECEVCDSTDESLMKLVLQNHDECYIFGK